MQQRTDNLEYVQEAFESIDSRVRLQGALNHQQLCKEAEPLFRDVLNELFSLKLRQINLEYSNHECYDLVDESLGVAIQVTTDTSGSKVIKTVKQFIANHGHLSRIIFAYPKLKKPKLTVESLRQIHELIPAFDQNDDRLSLTDLARLIQGLEIQKQNAVVSVIRSEWPLPHINIASTSKASSSFAGVETVNFNAISAGGKDFFQNPECPLICIVGGGFSGTVCAIRFLELVSKPINVLLIDEAVNVDLGGVAYGSSKCGWEHLLNIQAGRISLYRERSSDFLDWVNSLNANEKGMWPERWQREQFHAASAVPRRVYGAYLRARLESAVQNSSMMAAVKLVRAKALNVIEFEKFSELTLENTGRIVKINPEYVVLATGHDEPIIPPGLSQEVIQSPHFYTNPYCQNLSKNIKKLNSSDKVLIIGTGLSAYDAVLSLRENGFSGKMVMLSRNGKTHKPYPDDHIHEIVPIPLPEVAAHNLPVREMMLVLEKELERSKSILKAIQPLIHPDVIEERALKSLEPWVASWIQNASHVQVREFLATYHSEITTRRTGIVREVEKQIKDLRYGEFKKLTLIPGIIEDIQMQNGSFAIRYSKEDDKSSAHTSNFSVVICCLGFGADYNKTENPLWSNLINSECAVPHHLTGKGIKCTREGLVIRKDGSISSRILAVGPMRQGVEIEQNGRLGAFVFSIGTLRNQCLFAAVHLLKQVESSNYARLSHFEKEAYSHVCSEILKAPPNKEAFARLTNAILSVRFEGIDGQNGAMTASPLVSRWLQRHQQGVEINPVEARRWERFGVDDHELINYLLWHKAHEAAAELASDVTRLSPDYQRVLTAGAKNDGFMKERLVAASMLRAATNVFGAASGSILLYSPEDGKLHPFAMHRRIESFTKTAYGEAVNGLLVKSFYELNVPNDSNHVKFCSEGKRVFGVLVDNYNEIDSDLKKVGYKARHREYPSILASLMLDGESNVLGVVYLEAALGRIFNPDDVRLLAKLFKDHIGMFKQAQLSWDHSMNGSYRYADFAEADLAEARLEGQDLRYARFNRASIKKSNFESATLSGCVFDEGDLRGANISHAAIIGTTFKEASLRGAKFVGSRIKFCDFRSADLANVRFTGSDIAETSFHSANLSGITLSEHNVSTLDFSNAVLRNSTLVNLSGVADAKWSGVDLEGAKIDLAIWNDLPYSIKSRFDLSVHRI